jgi:hypothetical protein
MDTCYGGGDVTSPCVDTTDSGYVFKSFNGLTDVQNLWFTNFYHIAGNEYIGFMHEETTHTPDSCSGPAFSKTWRIGLAYSSDSGASWIYLGRSIEGHTPDNKCDRDADLYGAYAIYGDEIYLYYNDVNDVGGVGVGVAKAHLPTVISAARNSVPPAFTKLIGHNTWCGEPATVRPGCNPAFVYAGWPQNVYNGGHSLTNGKYYTTGAGTTGNRFVVQLFEQDYPWSPATIVATLSDEPIFYESGGNGYGSSVPATSTLENNEFDGEGLIVYFTRQRADEMVTQRGVYLWKVYIGSTAAYKHSADMTSPDGATNRWSYRYLSSNGSWSNLSWDPSWGRYHNPSDTFDFLDRWGMHIGHTTHPGLWWRAPSAGTVNVGFTVRKGSITCENGDGVIAFFAKLPAAGGEIVFMNQTIENQDILGYSHFGSIPVATDDYLVFRTDPKMNNYCDYILWDPWIAYQ